MSLNNQIRCAARACSDEMVCTVCGLRWDRNDPDPPTCVKLRMVEAPLIAPNEFVSGLPDTIR